MDLLNFSHIKYLDGLCFDACGAAYFVTCFVTCVVACFVISQPGSVE